jgi:hypothetical protein
MIDVSDIVVPSRYRGLQPNPSVLLFRTAVPIPVNGIIPGAAAESMAWAEDTDRATVAREVSLLDSQQREPGRTRGQSGVGT